MSVDPLFDQLSATTLASMRSDAVQDNFFIEGAWQRLTRFYHAEDPFFGGTWMQEPFMYDRVNGGAYPPAADVEVVQKQILAAMAFTPRAYKQDVPINMWVTEVMNAGPAAAVSTYDAYMSNAVQAMSTDYNIDAYQHGQAASATISQNRSIFMNGIDEALNNGIDPTYLGNIYTNYGGQVRNGTVGNTINSSPIWAGDVNGNTGPVSYNLLCSTYLNCVQDPDVGLCNKAAFGYIAAKNEPKQRFAEEEKDVRIGMVGFRILNAVIHVDKLAPSTKYGQLNPTGLSQTTPGPLSTFTSPSNPTTTGNFPASKTCYPGEPFYWLRLQDWRLRPARSPEYNHNFTPPIRSQNNPDLIVMFYKSACTYYSPSPRDNAQIVGIGS